MLLAGRVTAALGAVVALVGTFLPWLASGSVDRSSYELLDIVERLGFSPDGPLGLALTVWPLAPLALVLCVVAQWPWRGWERRWAALGAAASATASAAYVGATAVAVLGAPQVGLFRVRAGPWLTLGGAGLLATGAAIGYAGVRWGRPSVPVRSAPS